MCKLILEYLPEFDSSWMTKEEWIVPDQNLDLGQVTAVLNLHPDPGLDPRLETLAPGTGNVGLQPGALPVAILPKILVIIPNSVIIMTGTLVTVHAPGPGQKTLLADTNT